MFAKGGILKLVSNTAYTVKGVCLVATGVQGLSQGNRSLFGGSFSDEHTFFNESGRRRRTDAGLAYACIRSYILIQNSDSIMLSPTPVGGAICTEGFDLRIICHRWLSATFFATFFAAVASRLEALPTPINSIEAYYHKTLMRMRRILTLILLLAGKAAQT